MEGEDWKPIASAPRDATDILIFVPGCGQRVGHWSRKEKEWRLRPMYWSYFRWSPLQPTYWMPLPPEPNHVR